MTGGGREKTLFLDPHFAPGLLVVSSSEATPTEQFLKLSQEQHRIQHSGEYANPKWFIPNTLKYYVLLHDMRDGDEQKYVNSRLRPSAPLGDNPSQSIHPRCLPQSCSVEWFSTVRPTKAAFGDNLSVCVASLRAEMDYEDIKQRYGSQVCYLLKINSGTSAPEDGEQIPDPWSKYLLRNDPPHQVSGTMSPWSPWNCQS